MFTSTKQVEAVKAQLAQIAASASKSDKVKVAELIAQAKRGDYCALVEDITPPVAAILFLEYNPYNRDWDLHRTLELNRRINEKEWQENGETVKFYKDAAICDGQNRLAAIALSGQTKSIIIVYGLEKSAISTLGDDLKRKGSESAKLAGIDNAKQKETILRQGFTYLAKSGVDPEALIRSNSEAASQIKRNDHLLSRSIELAINSQTGVARPVLKTNPTATLVFILLTYDWPEKKLIIHLTTFQAGVSSDGNLHEPLYLATQIIDRNREPQISRRDKLNFNQEMGIVIGAIKEADSGTTMISRGKLREMVRGKLPNPQYLGREM